MAYISIFSFVTWLGISVGLLLLFFKRISSDGKRTDIGRFVGLFVVYLVILSALFLGSLGLISSYLDFDGSLALWLLLYVAIGLLVSKIDKKSTAPAYAFCLIPLASAILLALSKARRSE